MFFYLLWLELIRLFFYIWLFFIILFVILLFFFFFFFQAEDGIRDLYVTGVQTCALPIFRDWLEKTERAHAIRSIAVLHPRQNFPLQHRDEREKREKHGEQRDNVDQAGRSEERRVGKECRSRGSGRTKKKKRKRDRITGKG